MRATTLALLLAVPSVAFADPPRCPDGMVLTTVTEGGSSRAVCAIPVEAAVQRPYPFTVTGRSALRYVHPSSRREFVPQVAEALRRAPF